MNELQFEHFKKTVSDAAAKYDLNQINFEVCKGKNMNITVKASFRNTEKSKIEKIMSNE